jgi:hypothetical protein
LLSGGKDLTAVVILSPFLLSSLFNLVTLFGAGKGIRGREAEDIADDFSQMSDFFWIGFVFMSVSLVEDGCIMWKMYY